MNIDILTKSKIKIPNFTSLIHKVLTYDVLNDDIIKIYYNKLDDDFRIIKIKKVSEDEREHFFTKFNENISDYCKNLLNEIKIEPDDFCDSMEYYKFIDNLNYYVIIDYLDLKLIKLKSKRKTKEHIDEPLLKHLLIPYFTLFKRYLIKNNKLPSSVSTVKISKEEYDALLKANCTVEISKEEYERLKKISE